MSDKYGYDRRKALRALNLGQTLQKTDRILTGNGKITVRVADNTEATFSLANAIQLGVLRDDLGNPEDLLAVMGKNYHEVAHVLFTPRLTDAEMVWQKSRNEQVHLKYTFNFLEEARIETLLGAQWPKAKHFFTCMVAKVLLKKHERPESVMTPAQSRGLGYTPEQAHGIFIHLLVHGRKYLPSDLREAVRAYAVEKLDGMAGELEKLEDAEAILDEYRLLAMQSIRTRGKELAILLAALYPNFFEQVWHKQNREPGQQHDPFAQGISIGGQPQMRQNAPSKQQQEAAQKAAQDEADGYEEVELDTSSGDGDEDEDEDREPEDSEGAGGSDTGSDDSDTDEDDTDKPQGSGGNLDSEDDEDADDASGASDRGAQGGEEQGETDDSDEPEEGGGSNRTTDAKPFAPTFRDIKEQAQEIAEVIAHDRKVERDLAEVFDALSNEQERTSEYYIAGRRNPTGDEREVAQRLGREFEKLAQEVAPGWVYGTDHGRLNAYRAMDPEAELDSIFDEWTEGREQDASVEAVILVDLSGSMHGDRILGAASFCWTLSAALAEVDAKVTVYGYSNSGEVYTLRGRDDSHGELVPEFKLVGGTSPGYALNAAKSLLNGSEIVNRVLVVMTDGQWEWNEAEGQRDYATPTAQSYAPVLNEIHAHKTLIGIQTHPSTVHFRQLAELFDVSTVCNSVTELTEPILRTIEGMVRGNVFHGN